MAQVTQIVLLNEPIEVLGSVDEPVLEIGIIGQFPSVGVFAFNGSTWQATGTRIFLRRTGDPAPTGLTLNDIVLQQN